MSQSTTNNTNSPAQTTPAAMPNPADILAVSELALRTIGHPAHHTVIYETIKKLGLWTDRSHNCNPRMWRDIQVKQEASKFLLYGKSVFGLREWKEFPLGKVDPNHYFPQRTTPVATLTTDQLAAKAERLRKELAQAELALKAKQAEAKK